ARDGPRPPRPRRTAPLRLRPSPSPSRRRSPSRRPGTPPRRPPPTRRRPPPRHLTPASPPAHRRLTSGSVAFHLEGLTEDGLHWNRSADGRDLATVGSVK